MLPNFDENTGLLIKAIHFSADKHRDQRRKDETNAPYINHPINVTQHLWEIGGVRDTVTLIAAVLHDTLEDTKTTPDEIRDAFGEDVLLVVQEVTDDKSLPKEERKLLQITHSPLLSHRAKMVKLSDKYCNLTDVLRHPPQNWEFERKQKYLLWTEQVVEGLRGVNPGLEAAYDAILKEGKKIFNLA